MNAIDNDHWVGWRSSAVILTLAGALLLVLLGGYGALTGRLLSDDYCQAAFQRAHGWWGGVAARYQGWSGLVGYFVLVNPLAAWDVAGGRAAAWLPTVTLALFVAGWAWAARAVTGVARWRALLLGIGAAVVFCVGAPNLRQSLFWLSGSPKYALPLALAGVQVALLTRGGPPARVGVAALALLTATLSEVAAAMQLSAYGLAWLALHRDRARRTALLSGLAAALVGFAVLLAAPGTWARQSAALAADVGGQALSLPVLALAVPTFTAAFAVWPSVVLAVGAGLAWGAVGAGVPAPPPAHGALQAGRQNQAGVRLALLLLGLNAPLLSVALALWRAGLPDVPLLSVLLGAVLLWPALISGRGLVRRALARPGADGLLLNLLGVAAGVAAAAGLDATGLSFPARLALALNALAALLLLVDVLARRQGRAHLLRWGMAAAFLLMAASLAVQLAANGLVAPRALALSAFPLALWGLAAGLGVVARVQARAALGRSLLLVVGLAPSAMAGVLARDLPGTVAFARTWDAQHALLRAMPPDAYIVLLPPPAVDVPASIGLAHLSGDTGFWVNVCAADAYGVERVRVDAKR